MTNKPSPPRDRILALVVAVIGLIGVAYELAGMTLRGWHTISYIGHNNQTVRFLILAAFLVGAAWWWWHSGHVIER